MEYQNHQVFDNFSTLIWCFGTVSTLLPLFSIYCRNLDIIYGQTAKPLHPLVLRHPVTVLDLSRYRGLRTPIDFSQLFFRTRASYCLHLLHPNRQATSSSLKSLCANWTSRKPTQGGAHEVTAIVLGFRSHSNQRPLLHTHRKIDSVTLSQAQDSSFYTSCRIRPQWWRKDRRYTFFGDYSINPCPSRFVSTAKRQVAFNEATFPTSCWSHLTFFVLILQRRQ